MGAKETLERHADFCFQKEVNHYSRFTCFYQKSSFFRQNTCLEGRRYKGHSRSLTFPGQRTGGVAEGNRFARLSPQKLRAEQRWPRFNVVFNHYANCPLEHPTWPPWQRTHGPLRNESSWTLRWVFPLILGNFVAFSLQGEKILNLNVETYFFFKKKL